MCCYFEGFNVFNATKQAAKECMYVFIERNVVGGKFVHGRFREKRKLSLAKVALEVKQIISTLDVFLSF